MTDTRPRLGGRTVRVEDVARVAQVSPITVSRALRTPEKVKTDTRERVLEAVARTGYVVDSIASSLRSGRSMVVTVFVANLENPHFAAAMQGALDAFEGSRFHLMFAQTGYSDQLSPDVIETMLPFRPAAVMFTGVIRREDTRGALRQMGVPVVEMWGDSIDPIDMLVGESGYAGGRLMGAHFAEQGFRHIAFSGFVGDRGNGRLEGFRDGLMAAGRDVELIVPQDTSGTFSAGVAAFEEVLSRLPECDAVFMGSDLLAAGAVVSARQLGIDVPGQVALAGYGDLDYSAQILPALTTVHVGDYEIGRRAGEMLRARVEGLAVESRSVQMPLKLMVRASSLRRRTPD